MFAYNSEKSHKLLCGGTDQRIRSWNLKSFRDDKGDRDEGQVIVIPAANDASCQSKFYYE